MSPVKYFLPVLILTLGITGCENTISGNGASKSGNSASQPEDSASQPGDSTFQPDYSSPQIAEIRAKWNQYKPADEGDAYYAQTPKVTAPYEAGSLTQAHLNDGLKMTRFIRYLAGLSENVYLVDGLNEQAQYGAVLLAALDTLSHAPPKPADMDDAFYQKGKTSCASSNLYVAGSKLNLYNREDLDRVVRTFIHDTDTTNYTHVGHRRWILHPSLQNLGFGLAQRLVVRDGQSMEAYFAAMQIADTSNTTDKVDTAYVAWPGEGYFPESFFSGEQAWSVSLNPKIYASSKCTPVVALVNVTTGQEWVFDTIGDTLVAASKKLKFFYFNRQSSGWPGCVIFRPDGLESTNNVLLRNNTFDVMITGLVGTDGKSGSISYRVTFFDL